MRGMDEASGSLFSIVDLEARIPARHPLRRIRQVVNEALASLDGEFEAFCTDFGRSSIPPERLIRASLFQILFSVRSERQLVDQMQYSLLCRWFVGLGIDDPVWVPTVFTENREWLLTTEMSRKVMATILAHRENAPLLSDDHFSFDGALVKARASIKTFQPKSSDTRPDDDPGCPPGPDATAKDHPEPTVSESAPMPRPSRQNPNADGDFRGTKRSSATHASTTDPAARLRKKSSGTGAMLCFMGHPPMENRNGLIVQGDLTEADSHVGRRAALYTINRRSSRIDPAADTEGGQGLRSRQVRSQPAAILRQAPCRTVIEIFSDRRPHDPPQRLHAVNHAPQTDRRGLRLGQNRRRHGPDRLSRPRTGAFLLHSHHGRKQPRQTAPATRRLKLGNRVRHAVHLTRRGRNQVQSAPKENCSAPPTPSAHC